MSTPTVIITSSILLPKSSLTINEPISSPFFIGRFKVFNLTSDLYSLSTSVCFFKIVTSDPATISIESRLL